jgi:uncharacterized protein
MVTDFHHFKGNSLSRSEKIQRKVTELILESGIPDEERENSRIWELKHTAGCCQIGRILAQRRGLDIEMAEIICTLHDIYASIEGKYKDHARKSAEIARKMLEDSGDFKPREMELITEAIAQHSDKHVYTDKAYVELAKDVDVFDCSLYENADGYYRLHKPKEIVEEYARRIKNVRGELGIRGGEVFRK